MNQAPDSGSWPKLARTTWASVSKLFRMSIGSRQIKIWAVAWFSMPRLRSGCETGGKGANRCDWTVEPHDPRGTHLQSKGGIRQNPDRDQSGTRSQRLRPAFQFTAPEEKGGFGNLTSLAVCPHRLTATRVTGNDIPPLRFQPYAPLAPHHALSLRFRKTTRLTTITRRVFAGRTLLNRLSENGLSLET